MCRRKLHLFMHTLFTLLEIRNFRFLLRKGEQIFNTISTVHLRLLISANEICAASKFIQPIGIKRHKGTFGRVDRKIPKNFCPIGILRLNVAIV